MSVAIDFDVLGYEAEQAVPSEHRHARAGAALGSVSVLHAPSTPPVAAPLRLTRRGVLVLSGLVAALGLALLWAAHASAPAASSTPSGPAVVVVAPGDSLWSIAARVAPDRDPRAEVADLQRRNHLTSADLTPGEQLRVR